VPGNFPSCTYSAELGRSCIYLPLVAALQFSWVAGVQLYFPFVDTANFPAL